MSPGIPEVFDFRCPYKGCRGQSGGYGGSPKTAHIVRKGRYWRAEDSKWIARFKCRRCLRSFSTARFSPCFGQKKRKVNESIRLLLSSNLSLRRIARLLKINRKTVDRKLIFLELQAEKAHENFLISLKDSPEKISAFQFDEMETFERSKCLPLSIALAVVPKTRKVLGFRVASMPANGPLADISRKKYGSRKDERAKMARSLFSELKDAIAPQVEISTDQNPKYPSWLKPHFPKAKHLAFKGRRGCVVGQGELKKIGFDPLFDLNHTAAMFRANVSRLIRRTWCTTKRVDRLVAHLQIYVQFHNEVLTAKA